MPSQQDPKSARCVPDPFLLLGVGSGDETNIGADSWFCKLSNHVIICIGLYWSTCSHVMVRTTKKRPPMSPDPFLACVMGSGNETMQSGKGRACDYKRGSGLGRPGIGKARARGVQKINLDLPANFKLGFDSVCMVLL